MPTDADIAGQLADLMSGPQRTRHVQAGTKAANSRQD